MVNVAFGAAGPRRWDEIAHALNRDRPRVSTWRFLWCMNSGKLVPKSPQLRPSPEGHSLNLAFLAIALLY